MDGSSNSTGSDMGLILNGPEGDVSEYALHFKFPATNNEVEYETLIARLKIAKEVGARHLMVFNDS